MGDKFRQKNRTIYNRSTNNGSENFYTKINSGLIEDDRLNFFQIGIMAYLLNQSDEWVINKEDIMSKSGFGKKTFNKYWRELIEFGYLDMRRLKGSVEWIVHEQPISN